MTLVIVPVPKDCGQSSPSSFIPWTVQARLQHVGQGSSRQGMLQVIGNQWTSGSLRVVLLVAMGLSLVPAAVSMLFDDRQALGSLSEGLLASPELQQAAAGATPPGAPLVAQHGTSSGCCRQPSQ